LVDMVTNGPVWLFFGGLITSLNPCMLMVAPLVAGYVGGSGSKSYYLHSFLFLLGFSGMLALIGLGAGALSGFVNVIQGIGHYVLALVYFLLGFYLIGAWKWVTYLLKPRVWVFYQMPLNIKPPFAMNGSKFGSVGLGTAVAFTPSPCITPVVLAVATYIIPTAGPLEGAGYLFSFGLGHGIPLLLAGGGAGIIFTKLRRKRVVRIINPMIGLGMLGLSIYFLIKGLSG